MMFQYLVAGLATGATLVLYEGSPLKRPEALWEMVDELGITVLGTSAKWIEQISVSSYNRLDWTQLTEDRRNTILMSKVVIPYGHYAKSCLPDPLFLPISSTSFTAMSRQTSC